MSCEMVQRLNYAAALTAEARKLTLPDFCGPVSLIPFCRHPESVFDLHGLIRQHEQGYFSLEHMISRAGLSVMAGLDISLTDDPELIRDLYNHPRSLIIDDCPGIAGSPVRGFILAITDPTGEDGHSFSIIPNQFLPRSMRRELNALQSCLIVDINLPAVVKPVSLGKLPEYCRVYLEDFGYSDITFCILTDKKVRQSLVELN